MLGDICYTCYVCDTTHQEVRVTSQSKRKPVAPENTIDAESAAEVMQVSLMTVTRFVKSGLLKGYKLTPASNAKLRIYAQSVIDYCRRVQSRDVTDQVRDLLS